VQDVTAGLLAEIQDHGSTLKHVGAQLDRQGKDIDDLKAGHGGYMHQLSEIRQDLTTIQEVVQSLRQDGQGYRADTSTKLEQVSRQVSSVGSKLDLFINEQTEAWGRLLAELGQRARQDSKQEVEIDHLEQEITGVKTLAIQKVEKLETKMKLMNAARMGVGGGTFLAIYEIGKHLIKMLFPLARPPLPGVM